MVPLRPNADASDKIRQPTSSYYRSADNFGRYCADCVLRPAGRQVQLKLNYGIAFAGFEQTQGNALRSAFLI